MKYFITILILNILFLIWGYFQINKITNVSIKIGSSTYSVPRDGNTYNFYTKGQ